MIWTRLISDKRLGLEDLHLDQNHTRSDFQRDFDRMIFSSPFRRLQNKTQVFPLPGSIFVHNRLTHSMEVSSVGRSMAREASNRLSEIHGDDPDTAAALSHFGDIVAAGCLCHDLGNPPFGHSGEKTISTFFSEGSGIMLKESLTPAQWEDFANFEGNANSFRLLTHQFCGRRKGGFAMTYSTLATIVKYPHSSTLASKHGGKFGFFSSEEEIYRKVATELGIPEIEPGRFARHPLVYLLEAADDICYQVMDLEDAHKLKIVSLQTVTDLLLAFFGPEERDRKKRAMGHLTDPNEKVAYLRSGVIGALVEACAEEFVASEKAILDGSYAGTLIGNIPDPLGKAFAGLQQFSIDRIYNAPEVVDIEIAGNRIINYLMETLTEAALHPDRNFSRLLLSQFPQQYDVSAPDLYGKIQAVLDHISGMTDVYALDLFRKLNGQTLPAV